MGASKVLSNSTQYLQH